MPFMKNIPLLLILSIIAVLCTACPYTAPFMVGVPETADAVWNGQWEQAHQVGDSTHFSRLTFKVKKQDELILSTRLHIFPNTQPERRNMKAFLRTSGDTHLLLIYPLTQNNDKLYTYYAWHMPAPDTLELRALDDHIVPDTLDSEEKLNTWLSAHSHIDSIWEPVQRFTRHIPGGTANVQH